MNERALTLRVEEDALRDEYGVGDNERLRPGCLGQRNRQLEHRYDGPLNANIQSITSFVNYGGHSDQKSATSFYRFFAEGETHQRLETVLPETEKTKTMGWDSRKCTP